MKQQVLGTVKMQRAPRSPSPEKQPQFFPRSHSLVICFLFVAALALRLYHIDEPPLNFHATRQYRSLIIARGYYFESSTSIPDWEKQVALVSKQKQGTLEPPITEFLVSIGYRILGGEHLWLPKLLSSVFWLIGGGILYRIGVRIAGADPALFALGFYLFLPFAVVASRSFQPDPLMVMLLLTSAFLILRYRDAPSSSGLAIAAVVSALAVIVKPISVFVIGGAFVALAVSRQEIRRAILSPSLVVFTALTVAPAFLFYASEILSGPLLVREAQKILLPQLLLSGFLWRGWIANIESTVGFIPLFGALLGTLILRRGLPGALMIGLWIGYVLFGLALNYDVATHDYYHLQLIPIVGLSLGPVMALVMNRIGDIHTQSYYRLAALGVLLMALLLSILIAGSRLANPNGESKVRIEQTIGEYVNHSTKTIFLSADYGVPLEYHGLLSGSAWPLASDLEWERLAGQRILSAEERFEAWFSQQSPEYFIVEDLREFEEQVDLKYFLLGRFTEIANNDDFLVFDLRKPANDA